MKTITLFLSLLLLLLASSCTETKVVKAEELERISAERRFREIIGRGVLRVAVNSSQTHFAVLRQDGSYSGPEVERIQRAAEKAKLRVFFFDAKPESLPGYIRAGRADIGIGGLKAEEIRKNLLLPVMEYSDRNIAYAFAICNDGTELRALLENGFVKQK